MYALLYVVGVYVLWIKMFFKLMFYSQEPNNQ